MADYLFMLVTVVCGVLTQYYFILCAGLIGLVYLIFAVRERHIKALVIYIITAAVGVGFAMVVYPYIITNVLGGNRGFGSLKMEIDLITVVTYLGYKLVCYVQILAKELFLGQLWLLGLAFLGAVVPYLVMRLGFKKKLPRKAWFVIIPGVVYFVFIALVSPFNSDRYVMASLPLLSLGFTFALDLVGLRFDKSAPDLGVIQRGLGLSQGDKILRLGFII